MKALTWPRKVISTLATRRVANDEAVWKRHSSSTNGLEREGSFFRSASWSGCSRRVTTP